MGGDRGNAAPLPSHYLGFSDMPKGAMASAQLYSLVETAKA